VAAETSDALMVWNAVSNSSDHVNSFSVHNSGRIGDSRLATVEVHVDVDSWLTSPMKE
jgi:hypothetical protein